MLSDWNYKYVIRECLNFAFSETSSTPSIRLTFKMIMFWERFLDVFFSVNMVKNKNK